MLALLALCTPAPRIQTAGPLRPRPIADGPAAPDAFPNDTSAIFGARMPCELCAITPKSVELAPVIAPFHARDALESLDTATGAPASGPAPFHEPEPETPGRRPALHPRI